jgi:hypothetical protein
MNAEHNFKEMLLPYLEGELTADEAGILHSELERSPELRSELAELRRTREALLFAFAPELDVSFAREATDRSIASANRSKFLFPALSFAACLFVLLSAAFAIMRNEPAPEILTAVNSLEADGEAADGPEAVEKETEKLWTNELDRADVTDKIERMKSRSKPASEDKSLETESVYVADDAGNLELEEEAESKDGDSNPSFGAPAAADKQDGAKGGLEKAKGGATAPAGTMPPKPEPLSDDSKNEKPSDEAAPTKRKSEQQHAEPSEPAQQAVVEGLHYVETVNGKSRIVMKGGRMIITPQAETTVFLPHFGEVVIPAGVRVAFFILDGEGAESTLPGLTLKSSAESCTLVLGIYGEGVVFRTPEGKPVGLVGGSYSVKFGGLPEPKELID